MNDYKVSLEIFEGPLDLLLYLIKKEEVDIYEIPLVKITDQYLKYIDMMKMLDLEMAGEFLVMASTLLYIKSKMLLPPEERPFEEEEEEEDPKLDLIKQLIEYKKFKEAAQLLDARAQEESNIFSREKSEKGVVAPIIRKMDTSIFDLITAFSEVLSRLNEEDDLREIFEESFSVTDKIKVILDALTEVSQISFADLFQGIRTRTEMVVIFLATLELIRLKKIVAQQTKSFGNVVITKNFI